MKKILLLVMIFGVLPCYSMKRSRHEVDNHGLPQELAIKLRDGRERAILAAQKHKQIMIDFFYPHLEIPVDQLQQAKNHLKDVLAAVNTKRGTCLTISSLMEYTIEEQGINRERLIRFIQSVVEKSYLFEDYSNEESSDAINTAIDQLEEDREIQQYILDGERARRAKQIKWQRDMQNAFEAVEDYCKNQKLKPRGMQLY